MIKLAEKPFITSLIVGLLISLFGLSSAIFGVLSIINGTPAISIGIVVLGLIMVNAGVACIIGGLGHIFLRKWASKIAFYGSIAIILVSLVGVLRFGGFTIKAGYAILIMIAAMSVIWYLSKRELGAFFLLSVVEHVIVIIIIIMLIYSGPINAVPENEEIIVTIEEAKKEPEPVLIKIPPKKKIKQEKKVALDNKKDSGEPVEPPKLQIKNKTDVESGSQAMASVPKLPITFSDIPDSGSGKDLILRAPGPEKGAKKTQVTNPAIDNAVGSAFKSSKKPDIGGIVPPFEGEKGKGGSTIGKESTYNPSASSFSTRTSDLTTGAAKPGFIGDIRGEVAGRKVVFWPKLSEAVKGTEGGSAATLEITVNPAGNVTKVNIVKKSGSSKLDRVAMSYVKQIRFEVLPKSVLQKDQHGEVVINFELVK